MEDSGVGGLAPSLPTGNVSDAINDECFDLFWKSFRRLQQDLVLPYDGDAMATNLAAEEALSELLSTDSLDFLLDFHADPTPNEFIKHTEYIFKTPSAPRISPEDNSPNGVELLEMFDAELQTETGGPTNNSIKVEGIHPIGTAKGFWSSDVGLGRGERCGDKEMFGFSSNYGSETKLRNMGSFNCSS